MNQILPNIKAIHSRLGNGPKKGEEPISKDWKNFVAFIEKVEKSVQNEKKRIVRKIFSWEAPAIVF